MYAIRRFVVKTNANSSATAKDDSRFMVDYATYWKMHPDPLFFGEPWKSNEAFDAEEFERDKPSDERLTLLLPATLYGFNLQDKKWGESTFVVSGKAFGAYCVKTGSQTLGRSDIADKVEQERIRPLSSEGNQQEFDQSTCFPQDSKREAHRYHTWQGKWSYYPSARVSTARKAVETLPWLVTLTPYQQRSGNWKNTHCRYVSLGNA